MFIDTHCHVLKRYYENIDEIINNLGNNKIIIVGIDHESNKEIIELCDKYNNVYGALGLHPSSIESALESHFHWIEENINHPKIVRIGETGLDYYWDNSFVEIQKKWFLKHINLSQESGKPIIIHSRNALYDTYEILKAEYNNKKFSIVMHCFSYEINDALKFIEIGSMIGVGGIVTYKNREVVEQVVKNLPLEKLLLETDSPYLTPVPYRGKKNYPYYVPYIAQAIADLRDMSVEKVYELTTENAVRQFDLNF